MSHARTALQIDPSFGPAMKQMAGLVLLRAQLRDNNADYEADFKEATAWQQKEAALRAGKQPQTPPNNQSWVIIGSVPTVAPPPKK